MSSNCQLDPQELAERLREAVRRALELLEDCPSGDRELCKLMHNTLQELASSERIGVFLALPLGQDGEPVDAVYAKDNTGNAWIVLGPHTLADTSYAAHTILHELAHALGQEDDTIAEALALHAAGSREVPPQPPRVREAAEELRRSSCTAELGSRKPAILFAKIAPG